MALRGRVTRLGWLALGVGLMWPLWAGQLESSLGSAASADELQVTVRFSKTSWVVGSRMQLEATLRNVSNNSFLVDVFGELDGLYWGKRRSSYVTSCWVLTWPRQATPIGPRGAQAILDPAHFIRLSPGEAHTTPLFLELSGVEPGSYNLRLAYTPRAATSAFSFPDRWEEQQGFSDPMWIGTVFSDPFTLQIVEAPPGLDESVSPEEGRR